MKLVVLIEGSNKNIERLRGEIFTDYCFIDTGRCKEEEEIELLSDEVSAFLGNGYDDLLLIKFSGRESVSRLLGDIFPCMIVSISYNSHSPYYSGCPLETFKELITITK